MSNETVTKQAAVPSKDPLIKAMRKAYRESKQCELDNLLAEETRWKRKATIAQNKLSDVRDRINKFAQAAILPEPKADEAKPAA